MRNIRAIVSYALAAMSGAFLIGGLAILAGGREI